MILLFFILAISLTSAQNLQDNLTAYFSFDETSGNAINQLTGIVGANL